ncbi:MAG: hypothetical protein WD071_04925 [Pseudohongiella sp.]|uniref:hypothetical protein n=1 Tax=Pseudohongiella sp. TaxID=1979412 RepID=UPI0034A0487B
MKKAISIALATLALGISAGASAQDNSLSFFITSAGTGNGANLGGLAGADMHCAILAQAAGVTGKSWAAYLSAQPRNGMPAVNARDRIGTGPWFNANGVQVAANVDDLHSDNNALSKENSLTETGAVVNGRGDSPNQHDILTGSDANGNAFTDGEDHTCSNWTSNSDGSAQVGHHDRQGGGAAPTSWNSAHGSRGCSLQDLQGSGGNGYFYCFATD